MASAVAFVSMAKSVSPLRNISFHRNSNLRLLGNGLRSNSLRINVVAANWEPTKVVPQANRILICLEDLPEKSGMELMFHPIIPTDQHEFFGKSFDVKDSDKVGSPLRGVIPFSSAVIAWLASSQVAYSGTDIKIDPIYEVGEVFELGIQLSYLLLLLALLGVGTFFVVRQVLVRRELDLSAKELQEQVRSGDANATELFELGAVMLRRKFYPAATKYLLQAIEKWDGDDQDLAQVYNALGVSYVREGKLEKGITQFQNAVKLQPGYVTAWNNLGDAYEKKKDLKSALKAFEEVLLFDPNNKVARPRVDSLRDRVNMYKGVSVKSKDR